MNAFQYQLIAVFSMMSFSFIKQHGVSCKALITIYSSIHKGIDERLLSSYFLLKTPMSEPNYKFPDTKQGIKISGNTINSDLDNLHDSFLHQGHEDKDEDEELIKAVLRRNPLGLLSSSACSDGKVIGKTFSMRADLEDGKQGSSSSSSSGGIGKAVRRAFSKRASSASATNDVAYCRIDHQYDTVPVADDENTIMVARSTKESDNMGNNIIETCRRFFGF